MALFFRTNTYQVSSFRIKALEGVIFFLIIAIFGRLFYLQIIKHDIYLAQGLSQRGVITDVSPERGRIFALVNNEAGSELYPLAINKVYYEVSVDPSKVTQPQNFANIFTEVLGLDEAAKTEVVAKVKKTDRFYELIAKDVEQTKVDQLQAKFETLRLDINEKLSDKDQIKTLEALGVNFVKNVLRFYPDKEVGAHILGFLGYDDKGTSRVGKYGLEGYFENKLVGSSGMIVGEKDVAGRLLSGNSAKAPENGADITLTIDRTVQYSACKALEKGVARSGAKSGTVIVISSETGAILAMCGYPSFDPNAYNKVASADVYNNNAVYHAYEPGSVMKVVAMAIAIDQGKVRPDTVFNDTGEVKFSSGQVIKNSDLKGHGVVSMKDVLVESLNTGIVFATAEVNNKIFEDYIKKFGFGERTDLDISQESVGDISSLSKRGDIYKATASFGQGITVTPLQMVNAVNVIANRGKLLKPYLISQIKYSNGSSEEFKPTVVRQVIDKATASQLSAMMVNIVDNGHSKTAAVPGYYVAGKTGTAQVANPDTGKYYADRTIHSFVGFAPNDNPKFTAIVELDYPTSARFAEGTAAPIFGEIAKFLLEYYQVPPSR